MRTWSLVTSMPRFGVAIPCVGCVPANFMASRDGTHRAALGRKMHGTVRTRTVPDEGGGPARPGAA